MPLMDALRRDEWFLGKAALGVLIAGAGVAAYVALRHWNQPDRGGASSGDRTTSSHSIPAAPKGAVPVSRPAASPSRPPPEASPCPPPAAVPPTSPSAAPAEPRGAPVAKATAPVSGDYSMLRDAEAAASLADEIVLKDKCASAGVPLQSVTPPTPEEGNGELSASATFEKVPLVSNKSSSDEESAEIVPKPEVGGAKEAPITSISAFDSSIESPVFGGRPHRKILEDDSSTSNFDPATSHPAFFGFEFERPAS